jgi:hypothetical protein
MAKTRTMVERLDLALPSVVRIVDIVKRRLDDAA